MAIQTRELFDKCFEHTDHAQSSKSLQTTILLKKVNSVSSRFTSSFLIFLHQQFVMRYVHGGSHQQILRRKSPATPKPKPGQEQQRPRRICYGVF